MKQSTDFLTETMHKLRRETHNYFRGQFKGELSLSSVMFLMLLHDEIYLTQTQITNILGCDKAHTSRVMNNLLKMKYIEIDKSKVRNQVLSLTEKGKNLTLKIENATKKWRKSLTEGISKEEIKVTVDTINKMINNAINFNKGTKNV